MRNLDICFSNDMNYSPLNENLFDSKIWKKDSQDDKDESSIFTEKNDISKNKVNNKQNIKNKKSKNEDILYLVPELVFITGIENEAGSKNRRQDIISKTKTNPNIKMSEINKIHNLINSDEQKEIRRNGEIISTKSSKKLADEWGINLGENLSLEGRILRQPSLRFDNQTVNPSNINNNFNKIKMKIILQTLE